VMRDMAREAEKSALTDILAEAGFGRDTRARLSPREYASRLLEHPELNEVVGGVYQEDLSGCLPQCPGNLGSWDISLADFAVEFDEEQHFNRYRLATLKCTLYSRLAAFPLDAYREFCRKQERSCLRKACHGKYWTSESTERQFGPSDACGTLGSFGSARWKQRAFYDMLKDFIPLVSNFPVVRVSIWDLLRDLPHPLTVRDALAERKSPTDRAIVRLICQRAANVTTGIRGGKPS
jgi:hypothetical protein